MPCLARRGVRTSVRAGFTVIELLVVIGVIILMLSILIVALGQAMRTSQSANTRVLLTSIRQGLVRFKDDVGYYPPLLDLNRALFDPPAITPLDAYRDAVPFWESFTTLPDYLIGYGNDQQDACGDPSDPTRPALGIRSPGRDGVWGATIYGNGQLAARNAGAGAASAGQVLGPYLELKDEQLIGSIDGTLQADGITPVVYFPGEPDYDPDAPKVLVDYWGTPLRYYRRVYPPGALKQGYRQAVQDRDGGGGVDGFPLLSDVFVLRPFVIGENSAIDGLCDLSPVAGCGPGGSGDSSTTYELNAAEFALLSAGADKRIRPLMRIDPDEFNRDNIVEIGP